MVYNNSANINPTGLVKADGSGGFSGETTTQYNVQVGAASNGLTSVAPTATSGIALVSQGVAANPIFGTVVPAGGGTGTTTVFTQGSVVFAGPSGVYAEDNANFFWDDTNNRLGIDTNTPTSSLDVKGSISAGTYGGTNAAPANGMIISGQVGIGTNSPGVNNQFQINPSLGHGGSILGTMTVVDSQNNQHAWNAQPTFSPTSGATICSSFEGTPTLAVPTGQTVTSAVTFRSSPAFTGNLGTITTKYGFWFDGGGAGAGTITTHYGAYFATPVAGTTKIPLYSDSAAIGTTGTVPPTNGLLVNGNIRNTALTASSALYANATQDITSVALTDGQLLIGSTGANPVASTLTAGVGIAITNTAGSISIQVLNNGFTWSDQTTNFSAAAQQGYFVAGTAIATLPAAPVQGNTIIFVVDTTNVLTITANTGQKIRVGSAISALAGTCQSTSQGSSITLVYRSTGATWFVTGAPQGTWTLT